MRKSHHALVLLLVLCLLIQPLTVSAFHTGRTAARYGRAGESAAKTAIAGKTLYPISIQAAPVSYDETYGQLIYFDNFSGKTGFTNIADIKLADFTLAEKRDFGGFTTLRCGSTKLSPNDSRYRSNPLRRCKLGLYRWQGHDR